MESTPGEGDASIDETYEVRCRPMIHKVDRLTTGNTKCELTTERSGDTNCDASYRSKPCPPKDIRPAGLSLCLV